MSSNINYSITNQDGSIVIRSTAKSYNLDHVTDKDIVSFYRNFSSYAMFDTGLMPLSGTGVLAIRSAGNHTQITFQHQPQINYINWGLSEGDRNAKTYLVAQPYRIWIGDLVDGDLFGARMFYSPYPITSSDQQLYHLNLPNTNCKGYRGNGVGWQCLYHRDSWKDIPFNEKIVRFAERCSGVETYNDANMSETDGPRFYKESNMPEYLWDPNQWQAKTAVDGLDWVLDQNLWIPVLVKDQDNQEQHYENGVPLTMQMAMLGNYQAYYTDPYKPKPINMLSRSDSELRLDSSKVVNWIARSHNSSTLSDKSYNVMEAAKQTRITLNIQEQVIGGFDSDDDEEEDIAKFNCPITGEMCSAHQDEVYCDTAGNSFCQPCFAENTTFCENTGEYLNSESENLHYVEKGINNSDYYIDASFANIKCCLNCGTHHISSDKKTAIQTVYEVDDLNEQFCSECIVEFISQKNANFNTNITLDTCFNCSVNVISHIDYNNIFPQCNIVCVDYSIDTKDLSNGPADVNAKTVTYCPVCARSLKFCPTGHFTNEEFAVLPHPFIFDVFDNNNNIIKTKINKLCISCCNLELITHEVDYSKFLHPFNLNNFLYIEDRFKVSVLNNIAFYGPSCENLSNLEIPF